MAILVSTLDQLYDKEGLILVASNFNLKYSRIDMSSPWAKRIRLKIKNNIDRSLGKEVLNGKTSLIISDKWPSVRFGAYNSNEFIKAMQLLTLWAIKNNNPQIFCEIPPDINPDCLQYYKEVTFVTPVIWRDREAYKLSPAQFYRIIEENTDGDPENSLNPMAQNGNLGSPISWNLSDVFYRYSWWFTAESKIKARVASDVYTGVVKTDDLYLYYLSSDHVYVAWRRGDRWFAKKGNGTFHKIVDEGTPIGENEALRIFYRQFKGQEYGEIQGQTT